MAEQQETDQPKNNELKTMVSELVARSRLSSLAGKAYDGKRDYYDEFGWKRELTFEHYYDKYQRQDIAARIIEAPAKKSWEKEPKIKAEDNEEFEEGVKQIKKNTDLFHNMKRADILSGIGEYGILLVGVKGRDEQQVDLEEPLEDGALDGPEDIAYLKPYHQDSADINEAKKDFVTDPQDPNFGKPEYYYVDLNGDLNLGDSQTKVHRSRVIHIAENKMEDEIHGRPRLQLVYNLLDDLFKIVGGSAEVYWKNARGGAQANVDKDFDFDEDDLDNLEEQIEEYEHHLRRIIKTVGVDFEEIQYQVQQPDKIFDIIISLIAAVTNIPKRILLGSERGELASSQDETNWVSYIEQRQNNFVKSEIIREFIDWCIDKGALPEAEYEVEFPNLRNPDETEEAEILKNISQAYKNLASILSEEKIMQLIEHYSSVEFEKEEIPVNEESELDEENEQTQEYFKQLKEGD